MNLYTITDNYKSLLEMIEQGEIPEEAMADTLEAVQGEFTDKADNIACYIKSLRAEAKALKDEAANLTDRAKAKSNKAERLEEYLFSQMQKLDKPKIETARNVIAVRKNPPSVSIFDIELLQQFHPTLFVTKDPEPNKTAIKALLNDGQDVKGCQLVQGQSLSIK